MDFQTAFGQTKFPEKGKLEIILCFSDFLENDVGLWDAFFVNSKNSSKHQSVLKPSLPVDDYLQDHMRRGGKTEIRDLSSLQVLLPASQKHLIVPPDSAAEREKSPIRQVCRGKCLQIKLLSYAFKDYCLMSTLFLFYHF